jgi:hypothetical protein
VLGLSLRLAANKPTAKPTSKSAEKLLSANRVP